MFRKMSELRGKLTAASLASALAVGVSAYAISAGPSYAIDANTGVGAGANTDVGAGANTDLGGNTDVNSGVNADANANASAGIDAETGLGIDTGTTASLSGSVNATLTQNLKTYEAASLMGATVVTASNEVVGNVDDLVVSSDGNITAAVVGVGGFLGLGQKSVAISFESLEVVESADGKIELRTSATADQIAQAPEFTAQASASGDANVDAEID